MFNDIYRNKKVLITGHTGFKGSWLSSWLLNLGAEVIGYSDEVPTEPSLFNELKLAEKITDLRGDIRDYKALKQVVENEKPDIIFHLAAHAIVRECLENPVEAFTTNSIGTVNLLDIIRFNESIQAAVFITSDKCYENVEWEYGYREDDQLGGKDPYSASKACAEIAFSAFYRTYFNSIEKAKLATARAGNVIGGGDWAKDRIVPDTMKAWASGTEVEIRSPMATRPWQHVLEPLSGYLWLGAGLLAGQSDLVGESFNFGPLSNVNKPVKELIDEMKKNWSVSGWFCNDDQNAKKEANLLKLSCDKALLRLDWLPNLSYPETCEFTVEWYKNFYESKSKTSWEMTQDHIKRYELLANERELVWARTL